MHPATYLDMGTWGTAEPSPATEAAIQDAIRAIPSGRTASYEHVAVKAGIGPGGARVVGNCMAKQISAPTWRVVWKDGQLKWPTGKDVQRLLLESEGVRFVASKVDPAFILR